MSDGLLLRRRSARKPPGRAPARSLTPRPYRPAATGRVLAKAQDPRLDVPPLDNTSMDGYAVRSADCASGRGAAPRRAADSRRRRRRPLAPGTAARIFTGAPIPAGRGRGGAAGGKPPPMGITVVVRHVPEPGEWIRRGRGHPRRRHHPRGSTRLRGQETGLPRRSGSRRSPWYRKVRAALFSTGNELVMPGEPFPPGAIYNSNRFTLTGLFRMLGCEIEDSASSPTRSPRRASRVGAAATSDIIVTSGGVSVGEEDHVGRRSIARGKLDLWRIALKPGRPLAFGAVRRADGGEASFSACPATRCRAS